MEYALTQKLCGVKMVPALLYGNEFKEIRNVLPVYEILPVEPCHDIPGHIKNLYTKLPHYLNQNEKEILEHAINRSFAKKDTKRSADYRKSIIIVITFCRGKICIFALLLLETLVNIQMLFYAGENKRNQKHIFQPNNQQFLHFLLCKIVIGKNLKVLSFRKFFGSYLHALIPHAGLQIKIVSAMTAFAESEERLFQQAKSTIKRTSNNQPGNIISNIILRSQVEEELKAHVYGEHGESWLKCLHKITTTTECEENTDSVPNDEMPTVTDSIQGYEEMTDTTDEISTLTPAEIAQRNTSNESLHNQLHSTLTSSDKLLPEKITMPLINDLQIILLK